MRLWCVLVGVAALAIAVIVAVFAFSGGRPDSPEELLDAYISTLTMRTLTRVSELIHCDVDTTKEISEKLAELGGQNIDVTNADIETPDLVVTPRRSR